MQMGVIVTATGQQAWLFLTLRSLRQTQLPRGDIPPQVEVPNLTLHPVFF